MQWTREQILSYLETYKRASALELSGAINVTAANIRHHLHLLLEEELVQVVGKRPGKGPGRPQVLYGLTSLALEDNLQGLLRAILDHFQRTTDGAEESDRIYQNIARSLLGRPSMEDSTSPIDRFNAAVNHLNDLGYHASWEAHPAGPRIIFKHCPYRGLPRDYPGLCHMDEAMVSILTGAEMELAQKRSPSSPQTSPCIFSPPGGQKRRPPGDHIGTPG